jgi:hypothetical protein
MSRYFLPISLSFFLAAQSSFVFSSSSASQADLPAEEYAVYAAVLGGDERSVLVVKDHTIAAGRTDEGWQNLRQQLAPLSQDVISDFRSKNEKVHELMNVFGRKAKYVLIGKKEFEKIFRAGPNGWKEFRRRYGNIYYYQFSRVGFNAAMSQALVYSEYSCPGTCGQGEYLLLSKYEGEWRVVKKYPVWFS